MLLLLAAWLSLPQANRAPLIVILSRNVRPAAGATSNADAPPDIRAMTRSCWVRPWTSCKRRRAPRSLFASGTGCAASTTASSVLDARAQAPAGSIVDPPPDRPIPTMTPDDQQKLRKDLGKARDRQAVGVKGRQDADRAKGAKPDRDPSGQTR